MATEYPTLKTMRWRDLRWTTNYGARDSRLIALEDSLARIYAPVDIRGPLEWCEVCQDETPHNEGQGCAHCYFMEHYK